MPPFLELKIFSITSVNRSL